MKTNRMIVTILLLGLHGYQQSHGQVLRSEDIRSENWLQRCNLARQQLRERQYSEMVYSGRMDITKLGRQRMDAFGLELALPFTAPIDYVSANYDPVGELLVETEVGEYLSITSEPMAELKNFWSRDDAEELSQKIFGDSFTVFQHDYEGFEITANDILCREDTKLADARRIEMIRGKGSMAIRSRNIEWVVDVSNSSYRGYATCFERDAFVVLDLEIATPESRDIHGTLQLLGKCSDFKAYIDH